MEESWRMGLMGTKHYSKSSNKLDSEEYNDVFSGQARTLLSRQYSFDQDIFRQPKPKQNNICYRTLQEFRIPESKTQEFYSDIFGNSRPSNSSSTLTPKDLSPFDKEVTSKLRPNNVTSKKMYEVQQMTGSTRSFDSFRSDCTHKYKGCSSGFSEKASRPEVTTFRPNSYTTEDVTVNSIASMVSSLSEDQGDETSTIHEEEEEEKDDDDEITNSFVIEINPRKTKEKIYESRDIDEAIAWAKEKYNARDLENECNDREDNEHECPAVEEMPGVHNVTEAQIGHGSRGSPSMELELLDEDIQLWSDGKEQNIRLLLLTLHHILWPSSGWTMLPLTDIKDNSNVKRAYQKARLCLHPDKMQQRSATYSQKYVAEKAFPILQDAWAAFISQDVVRL